MNWLIFGLDRKKMSLEINARRTMTNKQTKNPSVVYNIYINHCTMNQCICESLKRAFLLMLIESKLQLHSSILI